MTFGVNAVFRAGFVPMGKSVLYRAVQEAQYSPVETRLRARLATAATQFADTNRAALLEYVAAGELSAGGIQSDRAKRAHDLSDLILGLDYAPVAKLVFDANEMRHAGPEALKSMASAVLHGAADVLIEDGSALEMLAGWQNYLSGQFFGTAIAFVYREIAPMEPTLRERVIAGDKQFYEGHKVVVLKFRKDLYAAQLKGERPAESKVAVLGLNNLLIAASNFPRLNEVDQARWGFGLWRNGNMMAVQRALESSIEEHGSLWPDEIGTYLAFIKEMTASPNPGYADSGWVLDQRLEEIAGLDQPGLLD